MEIFFWIVLVSGFILMLGVMLMLALAPATYSLPITATGNPIGAKIGQAVGHTYFFILGDSSNANIVQACKNGGIAKISTVDYKMKNFMFIKQTFTCVVTGD
jgi:hypothetical protein